MLGESVPCVSAEMKNTITRSTTFLENVTRDIQRTQERLEALKRLEALLTANPDLKEVINLMSELGMPRY